MAGPRLLLIDNYDSFTFNLVQVLGELGADVAVEQNDAIVVDEVIRRAPDGVVLSPGPRTPADAGISVDVVRRLGGTTPLLGVCLGHQCIGAAYGARVERAARPMHGKTSWIHHGGRGLFRGLPDPFEAMRYHSLLLDRAALPEALECTAWTEAGEVMGIQHRSAPMAGVQFHPESIGTPAGRRLMLNFVDLCARSARAGIRSRPRAAAS